MPINLLGGGGTNKDSNKTVCIDCGAHAGLVTDIILHCGGISYSFEPNLYLYPLLQKKYQNNESVFLYQKAVSSANSKTQFMICDENIISQGNSITEYKNGYETQQSAAYDVEVIDLCEFLQKEVLAKHERIYFLKLDVEGEEFKIMDKLLSLKLHEKIDFIACETHERYFENPSQKLQELKDKIADSGADNVLLEWI